MEEYRVASGDAKTAQDIFASVSIEMKQAQEALQEVVNCPLRQRWLSGNAELRDFCLEVAEQHESFCTPA